MPAGNQFYDEKSAEEILRLASRHSSMSGSVSREQLIASAAELGISVEALEAAEQEYVAKSAEMADRQAFDKHTKSEFWSHLATYLIICGSLLAYDFIGNHQINWALYPLIAWGIAIAFHIREAFAKNSDEYEKEFNKWKRNRDRRSGLRPSVTVGIHVGDRSSARIEQTLDDISHQLDTAHDKIEAIKELRSRTGLGLKEAKDAVEDYNQLHQR